MELLNKPEKYSKMSKIRNPFGQGDSSEKIFNHTIKFLNI